MRQMRTPKWYEQAKALKYQFDSHFRKKDSLEKEERKQEAKEKYHKDKEAILNRQNTINFEKNLSRACIILGLVNETWIAYATRDLLVFRAKRTNIKLGIVYITELIKRGFADGMLANAYVKGSNKKYENVFVKCRANEMGVDFAREYIRNNSKEALDLLHLTYSKLKELGVEYIQKNKPKYGSVVGYNGIIEQYVEFVESKGEPEGSPKQPLPPTLP